MLMIFWYYINLKEIAFFVEVFGDLIVEVKRFGYNFGVSSFNELFYIHFLSSLAF